MFLFFLISLIFIDGLIHGYLPSDPFLLCVGFICIQIDTGFPILLLVVNQIDNIDLVLVGWLSASG